MSAWQVNSYTYDKRGRITTSPEHTYAWDSSSHLTKRDAVTFAYNGLGDLIQRTEGTTKTHYYYNYAIGLPPIVAEKDDTRGTFSRYYVWSPSGQLLYMIDAGNGNAVSFYHRDLLGSTLALTNKNGQMTDAYAYAPSGKLLKHDGSSTQPFTFVGTWGVRQETADGTLYHMRARYYDTATMRFLSRDPLWPIFDDPRQIDPYQYAINNPLNFIDPEGFGLWEAIFGPDVSDVDTTNFRKWTEADVNTVAYKKWQEESAQKLEEFRQKWHETDEYKGRQKKQKEAEAEAKRKADAANAAKRKADDEAKAKQKADAATAKQLADAATAKQLADAATAKQLAEAEHQRKLAERKEEFVSEKLMGGSKTKQVYKKVYNIVNGYGKVVGQKTKVVTRIVKGTNTNKKKK